MSTEENKGEPIMRCKLVLHNMAAKDPTRPDDQHRHLRFGAVWEGSSDKQAMSENAVFGKATPYAEFKAAVCNEAVLDKLVEGRSYLVTFTEAEQQ